MKRSTLIIGILAFALITVLVYWGVWALSKKAEEPVAIAPETVADYVHAVLDANRTVYTTHIVAKMHEKGIVEAAEGWKTENALPLPAQFLIETGRVIAQRGEGVKYRLVSLWPIYVWNLPTTDFEKRGLEEVVKNPKKPFYGFVRSGQQRFFQAIYADRAIADNCVQCHNAHPNSPRRDFKLNDVMGAIVITIPIGV
jgi:hypothetical protein